MNCRKTTTGTTANKASMNSKLKGQGCMYSNLRVKSKS